MREAVLAAALALGAAGSGEGALPPHEPSTERVAEAADGRPMPVALLRGLDKSSGRAVSFEAAVGETVMFGRLAVTVNACRLRPGDGAAAHLSILDARRGGALAFEGWMIADSPAVSALDHPRYDVWTVGCAEGLGRGAPGGS